MKRWSALQQDIGEVSMLKGGTIKDVRVVKDDDEFGFDAIEITVAIPKTVEDQDGNSGRTVTVQVWQDPEGNGPGYIALMGIAP